MNVHGNFKPLKIKPPPMKRKRAFTLIELIIVIAIIAILAAAIFVAIDPARRLHESRNARRWSDVTTLLDTVVKYQVDNEGAHYSSVAAITTDRYVILGTTAGDDGLCAEENTAADVCANVASGSGTANCVDLSAIGTDYLGTVPYDPLNGSAEDTRYFVKKDSKGAITIGSCEEEGEGSGGSGAAPTIELTR